MTKIPAGKRRKIAIELYYHADTRLNHYLWPTDKNGVFAGFFANKAKLPERWKDELTQFIGDEVKLTNQRRPGN